jgi:hypothetical protein
MAEHAVARALRFRPKKVTPEMARRSFRNLIDFADFSSRTQVETVTGMFPNIPKCVHDARRATSVANDMTFHFSQC